MCVFRTVALTARSLAPMVESEKLDVGEVLSSAKNNLRFQFIDR
jgi:hypothetical protein